MTQVTIFSSVDLEPSVLAALDQAGVVGFLRLGGGTGNRFLPGGAVPRTMAWDAVVFIVPGADDSQLETISTELAEVASGCESEPCLHMVTVPAQVVL